MLRALNTGSGQCVFPRIAPEKSILLLVVFAALSVVAGAGAEENITPENVAQVAVSGVVVDAVFGTDLDREKRVLVGQAESFGSDVEHVFCLTRIQGLEAPTTVTHAWYFEGQVKARVELKVGSSNWRTWSSKKLLPTWTGDWEVKVLDSTGKVLSTFDFTVN